MDAEQLAEVVAQAIEVATAPLLARVALLERRGIEGPEGKQGPPGQDADMSAIAELRSDISALKATKGIAKASIGVDEVKRIIAEAVAELPAGRDGKDGECGKDGVSVTVADLLPVVSEQVRKEVASIPAPRDGRDGASVSLQDIVAVVGTEVEKAMAARPIPRDGIDGKDGTDGRDGASVDAEHVESMVLASVRKAMSDIPAPKDGASVTVDDVRPLIEAEVSKAVEAIERPQDGIGIKGAIVDRAGHLVITFSDGTTKDVGEVVGRDASLDDVRRIVVDEVGKIPRPKDGRDGTLHGLKTHYDGERTVRFTFPNGDPVEGGVIYLPIPINRGIYEAGKTYEAHDEVTWGGSTWYAREATSEKPGEGATAWKLRTKKGRDGKDGAKGERGEKGLQGPAGKDLTQMGPDGSKWR